MLSAKQSRNPIQDRNSYSFSLSLSLARALLPRAALRAGLAGRRAADFLRPPAAMRAGTAPLRVVPKDVAIIMCITSVVGMLIGLSLLSSLSVLLAARYWLTGAKGFYEGNIPRITYVLAALEIAISMFLCGRPFASTPHSTTTVWSLASSRTWRRPMKGAQTYPSR